METKKAQTSIEELHEVMEMVNDTFYGVLSFNRNGAVANTVEEGMSPEQQALVVNAVNAGVRATLSSIEELDGEIRFHSNGCTAVLGGDLCRGMFGEINS